MSELKKQIIEMQDEMNEKNVEAVRLESQTKEAQRQRAHFEDNVKMVNQNMEELRTELTRVASKKTKTNDPQLPQDQLDDTDDYKILQLENKSMKHRINNLEQDIAKFTIKRSANESPELLQVQLELKEKEKQNQRLRDQIAHLQKIQNQITVFNAQNSPLPASNRASFLSAANVKVEIVPAQGQDNEARHQSRASDAFNYAPYVSQSDCDADESIVDIENRESIIYQGGFTLNNANCKYDQMIT